MNAFAEYANGPLDEDIPYLRELIAYDALCPASCRFVRNEAGNLKMENESSALHWSRQSEWPWVLRHGAFEEHHSVLDVGGSWAVLKYSVAKRCKELVSLDNDADGLRLAGESIRQLGFGNITQTLGDARKLPFADGSFDRVLVISVIEHIPDGHKRCVEEAVRVLKPGGVLLITMDIAIAGTTDNFYVDWSIAADILQSLGIEQVPGGKVLANQTSKEKAKIFVLMIFYQKG